MPHCFLATLLTWSPRRWIAATVGALVAMLLLGLPTAVIPNPVFGREIAPTDWALEVLVITSVLSGLLLATYVRNEGGPWRTDRTDRTARGAAVGGLLSFFAIGCPVCNKLVLIALGSTGAVQFFAPVQPYLAVAGVAFLAVAFSVRLRREAVCALPTPPPAKAGDGEAQASSAVQGVQRADLVGAGVRPQSHRAAGAESEDRRPGSAGGSGH